MLVFACPTSSHRTHGPLPGARGTGHAPTCPGCPRLSQPLCKVSLPRLWKGFALTYVLTSQGDHLTEFPPTHLNPAQQPGKTGRYGFQAFSFFSFPPEYTTGCVFETGSIQCLDIFTFCKAVHGSFCEPGDKSSMLIRFLVSLCAQNPPRSQAQVSVNARHPWASQ